MRMSPHSASKFNRAVRPRSNGRPLRAVPATADRPGRGRAPGEDCPVDRRSSVRQVQRVDGCARRLSLIAAAPPEVEDRSGSTRCSSIHAHPPMWRRAVGAAAASCTNAAKRGRPNRPCWASRRSIPFGPEVGGRPNAMPRPRDPADHRQTSKSGYGQAASALVTPAESQGKLRNACATPESTL
jgi:hypothetical protein